LVLPLPPTSGQLTTAGYTLANGAYSRTWGTFVVSFVISTEPSGGTLTCTPTGDVSAADIASVIASLASLGYLVSQAGLTAAGGLVAYSQSL
jgi:hypothetical protein